MSFDVTRQLIFNTDTTLSTVTLTQLKNTEKQCFHLSLHTNLDEPPPEWDCRQQYQNQLVPIACQAVGTCSSAITAAYTLADRWAIWNNQPVEIPSTAYITNTIGLNASLLKVWLFLQIHGTIRAVDDILTLPKTILDKKKVLKKSKKTERSTTNAGVAGFRSRDVYYIPDNRNIRADICNHGPVSTSYVITPPFIEFWEQQLKTSQPLIFNFDTNTQCDPVVTHDDERNKHCPNEPNPGTGNVILGSHSVRIIGWGELRETPYWILANSWGANTNATPNQYGANGYFLAKRGDGILEHNAIAGFPFLLKKNTQPQCCDQKKIKNKVIVSNVNVFAISERKLDLIGYTHAIPTHLSPLEIYKRREKNNNTLIPNMPKHVPIIKHNTHKQVTPLLRKWGQVVQTIHVKNDLISMVMLGTWVIITIILLSTIRKNK